MSRNKKFNTKGAEYVREHMPMIGLGTYQITDEKTIFAVLDNALDVGYRLIDTAQVYANEKYIGKALKELLPKYKIKRKDLFITSKLSPKNQGIKNCRQSVLDSLEKLQIEYLDLLLIHWPGTSKLRKNDPKNACLRAESWKELEKLQSEGKIRAIGVSNYNIKHLEELLDQAEVLPAVNQCECHPHWYQSDLIEFCRTNRIHFQAYSSFGSESNHEDLFSDEKINNMAIKYNCTVQDFLLSWALSQGMSVLPRSKNPEHVRANFKASKIKVSNEDIEAVKLGINERKKYCWDPEGLS
ncbi:Aldo_ket_red domain-containing protein [Meloidogyne graminicola]|uniref:Aldo_ket_red domain-containing protein n=1 Tax=Meloidogyne graminicola TaxID=189291 RepID=A0A8S9ZS66_9BILA|nr:Aldo_ket_red domain-containing protein [Meloidogyne graminicola]